MYPSCTFNKYLLKNQCSYICPQELIKPMLPKLQVNYQSKTFDNMKFSLDADK